MNEKQSLAAVERDAITRESRDTLRRYEQAKQGMHRTIEDARRRLVEAHEWLLKHRGP